MLTLVVEQILPAAFRLLPAIMRSQAAAALVTAIGLQESGFLARHQRPEGTAHGFWQFERAGVRAVLSHARTKLHVREALATLRYTDIAFATLHGVLEHNDVLACVFARLLFWPDPDDLPGPDAPDLGWAIYLRTWQPGRPHPKTWPAYYKEAWGRVACARPAGTNKEIADANRFDRRASNGVPAAG